MFHVVRHINIMIKYDWVLRKSCEKFSIAKNKAIDLQNLVIRLKLIVCNFQRIKFY